MIKCLIKPAMTVVGIIVWMIILYLTHKRYYSIYSDTRGNEGMPLKLRMNKCTHSKVLNTAHHDSK